MSGWSAWLARWLGRSPVTLTEAQAQRLARWLALPEPHADYPLDTSRWVVVDVEASGLNIQQDQLISIGAIAIHGEVIQLHDSFDIVLQQDNISPTANILVHGIGGMAQRRGDPPAEALLQFLEYLDKSPLVAFHAAFDAAMIGRAMRRYLGAPFKRPMLDLAALAPALFPHVADNRHALDDWLSRFQIRNLARHNALCDAYATAALMQVLIAQARRAGMRFGHQLFATEAAQRQLSRMNSGAF